MNAGVSLTSFRTIEGDLQKAGDLNDLTIKFLELLSENRRLSELPNIATKFAKFYNVMNKEEKIIIISAQDLT